MLVFSLDDMEAELALHRLADLAYILAKSGALIFRDKLPAVAPAQFAAAVFAAGIIRIFFGQRGKVSACLDLLQHVICLGARRIHGLLVHFAVWSRLGRFDQDMAGLALPRPARHAPGRGRARLVSFLRPRRRAVRVLLWA